MGLGEAMDMYDELRARDAALAKLEETRARLISIGRTFAVALAIKNGSVTSIDVKAAMVESGSWDETVDPRWLGAIFRDPTDTSEGAFRWERIGWRSIGSHGRPVAVWRRA